MKKKTNYFTVKWWGLSLLLIVCTFNACEWEEEIIETQKKTKNDFFFSSKEAPAIALPSITQVKESIADSTVFHWQNNYGNAIWEDTECFIADKQRVIITPITKSKSQYDGLIIFYDNNGEVLVYVISREKLLALKNNHPLYFSFIRKEQEKYNTHLSYIFKKDEETYPRIKGGDTKGANASSIYVVIKNCWHVYKGSKDNMEYSYTMCNRTLIYFFAYASHRGNEVRHHSSNGGGSGGSGSGVQVSYTPPEPKVNDEDIKDTKADCIKQALESGGSSSLLNKLLAGFKLENSPIDLTYKTQDKVYNKKGDEVNGLCKRVKYSNNSIKLTIYISQSRMQTQSFLETARTILHETFHAHLYGMIYAEDNTAFNTIPDADGLDFRTNWDKYIKLHPKQTQHNWMAEKYIGLMKEGLSKLYEQWDDATKIRFEEYAGVTDANRDFMFECIAWHGLLGENHDMTEAGKEFYTKKGEEYEKMKDEVIRYLGKNCPTEK